MARSDQRKFNYKAIIIFIDLCFLITTNKWLSWDDSVIQLSANDVYEYAKIAEASPTLLNPNSLNFHHAQRLISPYLLGAMAKFTTIPYQYLFGFVVFLCSFLVIFSMDRILTKLKLKQFNYCLCISLLILNPYVFRYYWIVPGMLPDVIFTTGLAITIVGLVDEVFLGVAIGLLVAAIGRQTALTIIPGVVLWLFASKGWARVPLPRRLGYSVAVILIPGSIYILTSLIATKIANPSQNAEIALGLLRWLQSDRFSILYLAEFIMRLLIPVSVLVGNIIGIYLAINTASSKSLKSVLPIEFWACILMNISIIIQPFLGGPEITGQNASRLSALGFFPLLVALSLLLNHISPKEHQLETQQKLIRTSSWAIAIGLGMAIASLHHLYTTFGPPNALIFAAIQIISAATIGYCAFRIVKISRSSDLDVS